MAMVETLSTAGRSLQAFLNETCEHSPGGEAFVNETPRALRIEVDGGVWIKPGAAIASRGQIAFERRHTLDAASVKDAALREAAPLVYASGRGRLYCAHHGAHVRIVELAGERLVVSWHDLLAFEDSLAFESTLVGHGVGLAAGGLVVLSLAGSGSLALLTHGQPLTLPVSPGRPICTDPHATLAWSATLTPTLKTDLGWRWALGHGGGEPFQMFFEGTGFVIVQPYETAGRFDLEPHPIKLAASRLAS